MKSFNVKISLTKRFEFEFYYAEGVTKCLRTLLMFKILSWYYECKERVSN